MRYLESLSPARPFAMVYIGDGIFDRKILHQVAKRLNGKSKALFFPTTERSSTSKTFKGVISVFKLEFSLFGGEEPILIVIDKEHAPSIQKMTADCSSLGVTMTIDHETSNFIRGRLNCGSKDNVVLIAIQGHTKCIEENISQLIERHLGVKVEPTKDALREFTRERDMSYEDLLEHASKAHLRECFESLHLAIECLETILD